MPIIEELQGLRFDMFPRESQPLSCFKEPTASKAEMAPSGIGRVMTA